MTSAARSACRAPLTSWVPLKAVTNVVKAFFMVMIVVVILNIHWNFLLDIYRNLNRVGFGNRDFDWVWLRNMDWMGNRYRDFYCDFHGVGHPLFDGIGHLLLDVDRVGLRDVHGVRLLYLDFHRDLDRVGHFLLDMHWVGLRHRDLDLLGYGDGLDMSFMLLFVVFGQA